MAPSADTASARSDSRSSAMKSVDSDRESLAAHETFTVSDGENPPDIDHWFGKKWFACFLSQQLVSTEWAKASVFRIDSVFEAVTRNYQYQAVFTSLCEVGLAREYEAPRLTGLDEAEAVLILCGGIISRGSSQEQQKLIQVLRQHELHVQPSRRAKSRQEAPRPTSSMTNTTAIRDYSLDEVERVDRDLPRYTAKLKERCDKVGDQPEYIYEETDDIPNKHRCVLVLRDYTFEGAGSTKQRAKHEASKDACKVFGISIR